MATIEVREAVTARPLGSTHTHEVPRVGEAINWHGSKWRVLDVEHPTEDKQGVGIYPPLVYVVAEDAAAEAFDQQ